MFKKEEYSLYFNLAKSTMDAYWKSTSQEYGERKDQQKLALANKYGESDYTILDLEYQVSELSPFKCTYIGAKGKEKKPRFDIIAISKDGRLVIIELKKGTKALDGISGLKEHYDCYKASIGRNTEAFMAEMRFLLGQKQYLGLLPQELSLKFDEPQFIFAFTYAKEEKNMEAQLREFIAKSRNAASGVPYIVLPENTFSLKDENHNP